MIISTLRTTVLSKFNPESLLKYSKFCTNSQNSNKTSPEKSPNKVPKDEFKKIFHFPHIIKVGVFTKFKVIFKKKILSYYLSLITVLC